MPNNPLTYVLQLLRPVAGSKELASESVLLDQFTRQREEAAFASLITRHGPMVLAICRRLLGDDHLAEHAFRPPS